MSTTHQQLIFFKQCWETTRVKTKSEQETFLISRFKESLKQSSSSGDFRHEWQVGDGCRLAVCRRTWYTVYGFTKYEVDICASILKHNFEATSLTHKPYADTHLHEFTHAETVRIFEDNVQDWGGGK